MTRTSKSVRLAALAIAGLVVNACAGPQAPIDVAAKEVHLDLLLGRKIKPVAEAPVPPLLVPEMSFFRTITQPPTFEFSRPTFGGGTEYPEFTLPAGLCPQASPLAVPADVAQGTFTVPPKEATLPYNTAGTLVFVDVALGRPAQVSVLAPLSTVKITQPTAEPLGGFTYKMTVENAATGATTTTYRYFPTGTNTVASPTTGTPVPLPKPPSPPATTPPTLGNPPSDPAGIPAGLYLTAVEEANSTVAFRPQFPGIPIVQAPMTTGDSLDAVGTDGITTMSWRSTVLGKTSVDACGTLLDSYLVELTDGRISGGERNETVNFTSRMHIGPQFGGLVLASSTSANGTAQGGMLVNRSSAITIATKPALV